jgi:hypothetical protein
MEVRKKDWGYYSMIQRRSLKNIGCMEWKIRRAVSLRTVFLWTAEKAGQFSTRKAIKKTFSRYLLPSVFREISSLYCVRHSSRVALLPQNGD